MKLDDVLTAVKDVDNLCDFSRCKAKTSLMGQDCEYCSKRFCFKHGLPEGNLAKLSFIGGIGKSVIFERLHSWYKKGSEYLKELPGPHFILVLMYLTLLAITFHFSIIYFQVQDLKF